MFFIREKNALYASAADMASYMGMSTDTARRIIEEMKEYRGRYPYAVGKSGGILRVNILAFVDYFTNRDDFKKNRPVPPYDPKAVRDSLGYTSKVEKVQF